MSVVPVLDAFQRMREETPGRQLFVFVDDDGRDVEAVTVGQLDDEGRRIARALEDWNIGSGDRVALVYPPGLDFVKALVGCLMAGVIPVPVYPPDPLKPGNLLTGFAAIAADCDARAALTNRAYDRARTLGRIAGLLGGAGPEWPRIPWHRTDRRGGSTAPFPTCARGTDLDATALLQYTSGSTGAPRGVMISHRNLAEEVAANATDLGLGAGTRGVFWLPQYHDFGLISVILSTLSGNADVTYLLSPLSFVRRPAVWFSVLSRVRATHTAAPNFAFDLAVRRTTPEMRRDWDLRALRIVMSAAEPIRSAAVDAFFEAFAVTGLRSSTFYPAYGLAEHTVSVSMGGTRRLRLDKTRLEQRRAVPLPEGATGPAVTIVSCGRLTKKAACLRIVDPDTRRPRAPGEIGEIWVDSPTKALGYWGRPRETAETFCARLADEPSGREYLRTGDLGFLHDGELFVTGRLKDLIIIRGHNFHPQDIEDSVRDCHPLVRPGGVAAFALAPTDPQDDERLVLFVESREPAPPKAALEELLATVRRRVSEDHGLACAAILVGTAGLVRKTTSGKVRRHACLEAYLHPEKLGASAVLGVYTAGPAR